MKTASFAVVLVLLCCSSFFGSARAQECDTCTYVVGAVESWLESNSTVEEMIGYLDQLCGWVPGWEAVCDQIVQYGVEEFIQLVETTENPTQVCTQIGLCGSSVSRLRDTNCFLCEQVIGAIEGWIDDSSTEQEIESSLDSLCSWVPGFTATCDAIIAAGVPTVISWIEKYENASVVCTQLEMCGNADMKTKIKNDDPNCDICQTLITAIEGWMSQNKTEVTIENDLEKYFCSYAASPFQFVCDAIAEKGIPTLVEWIDQNESPIVVCQQLGICGANKKVTIKPVLIN